MQTASLIAIVIVLLVFPLVVRGDAAAHADSLDGTWLPAEAQFGGKPWPEEVRKITRLIVDGEKYTVMVGDAPDKGILKLDPSCTPKAMDVTGTEGPNKGKTFPAIYERSGDTLRICYDLSGTARPTEFKSTAGTQLFLVTYKLERS